MNKKIERTIEAAVRWSGGSEARAKEIFLRQAELDTALREQFQEEASGAYIENTLIPEAVERGYTLDRPAELVEAIGRRLENGRW
jgi:hypothetical protein